MLEYRRATYPVVDGSGSVVGVVSLEHLRRGRRRNAETVRDVMSETVPTVTPDTPMFDVVGLMNSSRATAAIVEEDDDDVGTITAAGLATTLQVRREAGPHPSPRVAM